MINIKRGMGSSQSAGKFRLPRRVIMNTKRVIEILIGCLIASSEIRNLKAIYSEYGRVISEFMVPTKYGVNCCVKAFALRAVQSNG